MVDWDAELETVTTESAAELMNTVWYDTVPLGSLTSISPLNKLLDIPLSPHPTAILRRGDAVEIKGGAACGKTLLLKTLLLTCITPSDLQSSGARGWGKSAVVFDCDNRWDSLQLRSLLEQHLYSCSCLPSYQDRGSLIASCLQRVHIFRPGSPLALACTLQHLEEYISACMRHEGLGMLLLDNLSNFFWEGKFAENGEESRSELQVSLWAVHQLRLKFRPIVLISGWEMANQNGSCATSSSSRGHPFESPHRTPTLSPRTIRTDDPFLSPHILHLPLKGQATELHPRFTTTVLTSIS